MILSTQKIRSKKKSCPFPQINKDQIDVYYLQMKTFQKHRLFLSQWLEKMKYRCTSEIAKQFNEISSPEIITESKIAIGKEIPPNKNNVLILRRIRGKSMCLEMWKSGKIIVNV